MEALVVPGFFAGVFVVAAFFAGAFLTVAAAGRPRLAFGASSTLSSSALRFVPEVFAVGFAVALVAGFAVALVEAFADAAVFFGGMIAGSVCKRRVRKYNAGEM